MKLKGSVALVTGAGRGIGKAIALRLAAEGASVVLNSRTKTDLESVLKEIQTGGSGSGLVAPADITDDHALAALFKLVDEKFGRIDILINNAGIGRFAPVRELRVEDLDAMWTLNMRALFQCTKFALARMEPRQSGAIINIASLAGKNAFTGGSGYAATKWALLGFTRCIMLEVRDKNIRVVAVCPGSVDTDFSGGHDRAKAGKILAPEDVAEVTMTALTLPLRALMSEIDLRPTNPR